MKIVAYIMVIGISLLGMNRFMIGTEMLTQDTEQTCDMECCGSDNDCEHEEDGIDLTHACPNGCDCSCCYHIMAIAYQFISIPVATVQSYHYGTYIEDYQFEFNTPLFEPPRLG